MQDRVIRFVVENSQISEKQYRDLMFRTGELARDIGTVVVGRDAVRHGLIDDVGGLSHAVAKLRQLISQMKAEQQGLPGDPAQLATAVQMGQQPSVLPGDAFAMNPGVQPGMPTGSPPGMSTRPGVVQ